jgi:hypothetical protein
MFYVLLLRSFQLSTFSKRISLKENYEILSEHDIKLDGFKSDVSCVFFPLTMHQWFTKERKVISYNKNVAIAYEQKNTTDI